jgi:hypothetical protein
VEMNVRILNPELQHVLARHRERDKQRSAATVESEPSRPIPTSAEREPPLLARSHAGVIDDLAPLGPQEQLRAMVLAIDPEARFVIPSTARGMRLYVGPIAVALPEPEHAFAQHTGRSVYALHATSVPAGTTGLMVEVKYEDGLVNAKAIPLAEHDKESTLGVTPSDGPISQAGASDGSIDALAEHGEDARSLSAHEWLASWAADSNKRISEPIAEDGSVDYTVLYVGRDGVVINKGRSGAVYPSPMGFAPAPGDILRVGPTAALELPEAREKDDGKAPAR